jgi:hypothetical protein
MQNFLKKSLCVLTLLTSNINFSASASGSKLPSVADVFGGLSEQEIAEQVQMGQQFLEDLQKNGTPQEIAEFQRLLEETLNSMSEEDFKDIQAIAQMVEPHIVQSQPEPVASAATSSSSVDTSLPATSSDLEDFKKLISTITQRIDDIFQKINSSKECAEQVDNKWKNKSTFANMKRQMYQLKNDRLAQKLCKKDLKDDDKKLVDQLKTYLKDLTAQNDALVIEDDFGLPASFAEEKKHLKQTKAFLETCDETIDTLMPLLEKFLQKWDPEALQLAKETETRSAKATTQATDATKRQGSANAQSKTSAYTGGYGYNPAGSDYGSDYGGGYYPDYENYPGGGYNPSNSEFGSSEGSSGGASGSGDKSSKAKSSEVNTTAPGAKEKNYTYEDAMGSLEDHLNEFDSAHESKFVNFMKNDMIKNYPSYSALTSGGALSASLPAASPTAASIDLNTTNSSRPQEEAFVGSKPPFPLTLTSGVKLSGFKNYAVDTLEKVKKEFHPEFEQLHTYLSQIQGDIKSMAPEDLKKVSTAKAFNTIETRLKRYQQTFEDALPELKKAYDVNTVPGTANAPNQQPGMLDEAAIIQYRSAHESFVKELQDEIGEEITKLMSTINTIKHSAKRTARRKNTQKAPTVVPV